MKNNCKLNVVVKVASLIVIALIAMFAVAGVKAIGVDNYKAILDYDTLADAQEAAKELNIELTGEGSVLLKNDGTLPVEEGTKVVVFGAAATSLQGGTGRVDTALAEDGFDVYPTVFNETNRTVYNIPITKEEFIQYKENDTVDIIVYTAVKATLDRRIDVVENE